MDAVELIDLVFRCGGGLEGLGSGLQNFGIQLEEEVVWGITSLFQLYGKLIPLQIMHLFVFER